MMQQVPGHALVMQGAPHYRNGHAIWHRRSDGQMTRYGGAGRGKCECGELSEVLPSDAKRKAWHREHKVAVVQGLRPSVGER